MNLSLAREAVFGILRHGVMGCECLFTLHVDDVCDHFHDNWRIGRGLPHRILQHIRPSAYLGERQLSEIWNAGKNKAEGAASESSSRTRL